MPNRKEEAAARRTYLGFIRYLHHADQCESEPSRLTGLASKPCSNHC
jgi:hypothetical protein